MYPVQLDFFDLAVCTNGETISPLLLEVDDAAGIYKTNLVIMDNLTNEKLRENIERDGIEIYKSKPRGQ